MDYTNLFIYSAVVIIALLLILPHTRPYILTALKRLGQFLLWLQLWNYPLRKLYEIWSEPSIGDPPAHSKKNKNKV